MSQINNNTNKGSGKHINYEKRLKIVALSKAGMKSEKIGLIIGCSGRAVRNELNKGGFYMEKLGVKLRLKQWDF